MTWRVPTCASDLIGERLFCRFIYLVFFVVFRLTVFFNKILKNFCLPARHAVIVDCEAGIRERCGALLFALNKETAAKVNRRRFLSLTFFWIYLKFGYLLGDVAKIRWPEDDDVARSRKTTDLGLLTQAITESTAKNDRGRNIDIS